MTLGEMQREFTVKIASLIVWAYREGYEITLGDAYRDPRLHGEIGYKEGYGHKDSYHKKRLAIDLNLFKDGKYLTDTEAHRPIGEQWKSMGGTWGGDFSNPDGNHYSLGESR